MTVHNIQPSTVALFEHPEDTNYSRASNCFRTVTAITPQKPAVTTKSWTRFRITSSFNLFSTSAGEVFCQAPWWGRQLLRHACCACGRRDLARGIRTTGTMKRSRMKITNSIAQLQVCDTYRLPVHTSISLCLTHTRANTHARTRTLTYARTRTHLSSEYLGFSLFFKCSPIHYYFKVVCLLPTSLSNFPSVSS